MSPVVTSPGKKNNVERIVFIDKVSFLQVIHMILCRVNGESSCIHGSDGKPLFQVLIKGECA